MDTRLSKLEHDKAGSVWSGSHEELELGNDVGIGDLPCCHMG